MKQLAKVKWVSTLVVLSATDSTATLASKLQASNAEAVKGANFGTLALVGRFVSAEVKAIAGGIGLRRLVEGDAQVQRHELERQIISERFNRAHGRLARAAQRVLMWRVDHHLQHLGFDFAGPNQVLDRVL